VATNLSEDHAASVLILPPSLRARYPAITSTGVSRTETITYWMYGSSRTCATHEGMWGSGGTPSFILNVSKTRRLSVQLHALSLHSPGKSHRYPPHTRLGGTQGGSGRFVEDKNIPTVPGIKPRFLGRSASSLVTVSTELSLHNYIITNFTICTFTGHYSQNYNIWYDRAEGGIHTLRRTGRRCEYNTKTGHNEQNVRCGSVETQSKR
jgi:hypothetical protein